MTTPTTATPTTQSPRVATVRIHSLTGLISRGVWTLPEIKRDALNAIRIPVEPGATDLDVAEAIENRVGDILTPSRHRHGSAVFVRPFALDRVMERPTTAAGDHTPTDGVHGYLLFGEREIGVVRVVPDPDAALDEDLLAVAVAVGVTS